MPMNIRRNTYVGLQGNGKNRLIVIITIRASSHGSRLTRVGVWVTYKSIDSSNITETGASALAAAFSSIPMLTTLNITWNDIGAKGGVAFAEALHHLELLETLNLCGCGIEDVGASELSVALVNVPWLVRLDVSYNKIHDDGLISLSSALHNVPQLQHLNANGNEHSSLGSSTLRAAAKNNVVVDTATRDELLWQGMGRSISAFGTLLSSVYLFIISVQWCCCSTKDKSN